MNKTIYTCVGIFAGLYIFNLFSEKSEINGLKNQLEIIKLKKQLEIEKNENKPNK